MQHFKYTDPYEYPAWLGTAQIDVKQGSAKEKKERRRGVVFDDVVRLGRLLPEVQEGTSYGTRSLRVKNKLFARLKEDGDTLVVKMDMTSRDLALRAQPDAFYLTEHYRNYPYVLVRLANVTESEMLGLLEDAWRLVAPARLVAQLDGRAAIERLPSNSKRRR